MEPDAAETRVWLDRYMTAFERSDPGLLEAALRDDAMLEMTPARTWFSAKRKMRAVSAKRDRRAGAV